MDVEQNLLNSSDKASPHQDKETVEGLKPRNIFWMEKPGNPSSHINERPNKHNESSTFGVEESHIVEQPGAGMAHVDEEFKIADDDAAAPAHLNDEGDDDDDIVQPGAQDSHAGEHEEESHVYDEVRPWLRMRKCIGVLNNLKHSDYVLLVL